MKQTIVLILILFLSCTLSAQKYESVMVKAGTRVIDYFSVSERYCYPNFTKGIITLKDGRNNLCMFNLNFLTGEMEFLQSKDTLIIADKKDLSSIVIEKDTFYFHNGYLQMIRSGNLKVFAYQRIGIKDILKNGGIGTTNRSISNQTYGYVNDIPNLYHLKTEQDMVFQKTVNYYFGLSENDITPFNRKNIIRVLPEKGGIIKDYLETNEIDFNSKTDLLKLADFVSTLLSAKSH